MFVCFGKRFYAHVIRVGVFRGRMLCEEAAVINNNTIMI